jgi:stage II sporulation protein E
MKSQVFQLQKTLSLPNYIFKPKFFNYLASIFSQLNLLLIPISFTIGRASIFDFSIPIGVAFYSSTLTLGLNRLITSIFILIGVFSSGSKEQVYQTLASIIIFEILNIFFKNKNSNSTLKYATLAFFSVFLPSIVVTYLGDFLLYDTLIVFFNSLAVFSLVFVFINSKFLLNNKKNHNTITAENKISACIVFAVLLSGIGNITFIGINLKSILGFLIILISSYLNGIGVGAASGIIIGIVLSFSSAVSPYMTGILGFCGLTCGMFRETGKLCMAMSLLIGYLASFIYSNSIINITTYLNEIIIAILLFSLLSDKKLNNISSFFNNTSCLNVKRTGEEKIKIMTINKLNKFSEMFKELSRTFNELSKTKITPNNNEISTLFDRVYEKTCKDCGLNKYCWDKNFCNTYQCIYKIIEVLEDKKNIEEQDIPPYLLNRCERITRFLETIINTYEIFKVNAMWKAKIGENKGIVSQQFEGVSKVIENLSSEISKEIIYLKSYEDKLFDIITEAGIKVEEINVYKNTFGKYEVDVIHKNNTTINQYENFIEKNTGLVIGKKMAIRNENYLLLERPELRKINLIEQENYKVAIGIASATKSESTTSGDTSTFFQTNEGKFVIAISDGMGSGQKAASQSRSAISMLENLLESGFDKDTALKLINSILVLKSNEDSFATIDLSVVDLHDGTVEFVKIGAVPTYIKRDDVVESIKSASLPAGILLNIEAELVSKKLSDGNFIIMLSDGILESFKNPNNINNSIKEFIRSIKSSNPQEIANQILNEARKRNDEKALDDMTVLVGKIWKKVI